MDNGHGSVSLLNALVFLVAAVVSVPISKRFGLGSVFGYLVAGALIGPTGLGLVGDPQDVMALAELGVVFLLFIIGLELNPRRLWIMRKAVFGIGGFQVIFTSFILFSIIWAIGFAPSVAALMGFALSLSSTAFALQMLSEKGQLNTEHGRTAFSILLFQDVSIIPALALVPLLGMQASEMNGTSPAVALGAIVFVVFAGRYLLRPAFRLVASTKLREVFTAASLLVVLAVAHLMSVIGLSMALGAFLAGVVLADSEYRHELEADIEPFKGLLLGLFFISVGMSVDYSLVLRNPLAVFFGLAAYISVKLVALFVVGRISGASKASSLNLAFAIVQGSEFAFVLMGLSRSGGLIDPEIANTVVVIIAFSMVLTPVLFALNEKYLERIHPTPDSEPSYDQIDGAHPVIIAGFGRVGQIVGRILRIENVEFTALEHDPEQVNVLRRFGQKVYYGDASRLDLLHAAHADQARLFFLAIGNLESSLKVAKMVRDHFPNLKIIARARNRQHVFQLMRLGVQVIERETFWSSLKLSEHLFSALGLSDEKAKRATERFREHDEAMLAEQYQVHEDENALIGVAKRAAQQFAETMKGDESDLQRK